MVYPEIELKHKNRKVCFSRKAINKVIFGSRMPEKDKTNLARKLYSIYDRGQIYQAKCNLDTFSVVIEEFKSPWL